ncbi:MULTISPECIES: hypothetical protein [Vibrio]|uniref:hypothetical protein n=1 Tax=Vibrio TaxID=662 RepID=UPI001E641B6D|nr:MULTISPECIES: hypothetical protein [Vibrio]MCC2525544.1 hypothetical protein [Vibrio coralliilyticus]USD35556.1 hypothetical protein J8Z27_22350 [Vibrio sp. SCSIO 43186]USD72680.1 hypothetical protein J4N41_22365 [Vibrio sp. SCSIO 43139]USD98895.1 hypothetical protein CTT30_22700 [Vibrio coralliilyticus]
MKVPMTTLLCGLALTGCSTTSPSTPSSKPNQQVVNAVTICGAGLSSSQTASIAAKMSKNLSEGINVSAGIEDLVVGAFMASAKVTEERAVELHDQYTKCVDNYLDKVN